MAKKDDPNRLVTLEVLHDPVRAEIIKDVLSQEGIDAITAGAQGGGGVLVGAAVGALDIPIRVRVADVERAKEIVDAMQDFDAVLPDGEDGPAVPADEMQRRLERLDADNEGEGPYREAPIAESTRLESPRLKRIAVPAAMILPFGGGHLYARDNRGAAILALTQVTMVALLFGGAQYAWWGFVAGIVIDAYGALRAVERYNEKKTERGLAGNAAFIAAVLLVAAVGVPYLLRELAPASYLEGEVRTLCECVAGDPAPCVRRELADLELGNSRPATVQRCGTCLAKEGCDSEACATVCRAWAF